MFNRTAESEFTKQWRANFSAIEKLAADIQGSAACSDAVAAFIRQPPSDKVLTDVHIPELLDGRVVLTQCAPARPVSDVQIALGLDLPLLLLECFRRDRSVVEDWQIDFRLVKNGAVRCCEFLCAVRKLCVEWDPTCEARMKQVVRSSMMHFVRRGMPPIVDPAVWAVLRQKYIAFGIPDEGLPPVAAATAAGSTKEAGMQLKDQVARVALDSFVSSVRRGDDKSRCDLCAVASFLRDSGAVVPRLVPLFSEENADILAVLNACKMRVDPADPLVPLREIVMRLRAHDDRVFDIRSDHLVRRSASTLVTAWAPELLWTQPPLCNDERDHLLLEFGSTARQRVPGTPVIATPETFAARWSALTGGALDGIALHALGIVAAGGAVVRCLQPDTDNGSRTTPGDVDLFATGDLYATTVMSVVQTIANRFGDDALILFNSRQVLIVLPFPLPRIQMQCGTWLSAQDVLMNADIDCCAVAYDGVEVTMTPRAYYSWLYRVNVPFSKLHRIRGSPSYEKRIVKYARRGFACLELNVPRDDPRAVALLQNARGAKRKSLLGLTGLQWLVNADALVMATKDDAAEVADRVYATSAEVTPAVIRKRVLDEGHMESDNYGQHEEGYLIGAVNGPYGGQLMELSDMSGMLQFSDEERVKVKPWAPQIVDDGTAPDDVDDEDEYD